MANILVTIVMAKLLVTRGMHIQQQWAQEELVASFLEQVVMSRQVSPCMLVLAHDYKKLPLPLEKMLEHRFQRHQPAAVIQFQARLDSENTVQQVMNETRIQYWFSWLQQPSCAKLANCNFFVTIGSELKGLLEQAAARVSMHLAKDYFFLWNHHSTGNAFSDILLHPTAQKLKFKLAPRFPEENVTSFHSTCFFCNEGEPEVIEIGRYEKYKGVHLAKDPFPDFATDLRGRLLSGCYIEGFNYQDTVDALERMDPVDLPEQFVLDLGKAANFKWVIKPLELGAAAAADAQMDDGTWTGNIGTVLYGEADFAALAVIGHKGRAYVDYTIPALQESVSFANRQPRRSYSWRVVYQPYTITMWLLIFLASSLASIFFSGLLHIASLLHSRPLLFTRTQTSSMLPYSLTYLLLTLIEENPEAVPRPSSPRVFLSFWWLFALVITCGYTSKLIGFLCIPERESLPTNIKEVVLRPKWTYGCLNLHCVFAHLVTEDADPEYFEFLIDAATRLQHFPSLGECMQFTSEHDFSCFAPTVYLDTSAFSFIDVDGVTPFQVILDPLITIYFGLLLPKYSILTPRFDKIVQRFWDNGIFLKHKDVTYYAYTRHGLALARENKLLYRESMVLRFKQVKAVFYALLIFAYGAGSLVLLMEKIIHRYGKK